MEEKSSHKRSVRWLKWILGILGGIVLLLLLARLALTTKPVQRWAKEQLVTLANEQLNVQLSVEELSGDLWKEARLSGIVLADEDTVASVDTLYVQYNLLTYFSAVLEIDMVRLSEPFLKLRQQDNQWNVSTWVRESEQEQDTTGGLFVHIDEFSLQQGRVDVRMPDLPEDSSLVVNNINLVSSLGYYGEDFETSISDFSFQVEQTRLGTPLSVQTSGQATEKSFSLEKLVVATGHTLLKSTGQVDTRDSTARVSVQAEPLSWRDVAAYAEGVPVRQDMKVSLDVGGNLQYFNLALNADATGLDSVQIGADIRWDTTLTVTGAWLRARELNLNRFLGDTSLPHIRGLAFEVNGEMPVADYQKADLQGRLATGRLSQGEYELEQLNGTLSLSRQAFNGELAVQRERQRLSTKVQIERPWGQQPATSIRFEAAGIDPGYWLQDTSYSGNMELSGRVEGEGFYPDTTPWEYSVRMGKSQVSGQEIDRAEFEGRFNSQFASNRSTVKIGGGTIDLRGEARNLQKLPQFDYELAVQNINVEELGLTEDFATTITGKAKGQGQGNSLANLRLASAVRIDSSVVEGEYIEEFSAQVNIADTVATVDKASLESTIAEGTVGARIHLMRWYDPDNEMDLDFRIKDISSLAPLMNLEELQAEGKVRGKLVPAGKQELSFSGEVNVSDVNYNNTFLADRVRGKVEVLMVETPEYRLDLELAGPLFGGVRLQDLELLTHGRITEEQTAGDFRIVFSSSSEEGQIIHAGLYEVMEDSTVIHTNQVELTTSLRTLNLVNPFKVYVAGQSVKMDTMRLESDDGAALELAASYADSLHQQGYLGGKNLNLTIIQELLLGESYVDGILWGKVHADRSDTELVAMANLSISRLSYGGTAFDTLNLALDISEEQLSGRVGAIYNNRKLIDGRLQMPFKLGDPAEFGDAFFERPLEGHLRVNAISLSQFQEALDEAGITSTEGTLEFSSTVGGTAASPSFGGNLLLRDAIVSGVEIDSVTAKLNYEHDQSKLLLNASVNSLRQKAAEVRAEVPFRLDLKSLEVQLPEENDSVLVDVETNKFNLAAVNDFVDRERIREVKGLLNGSVQIRGPQNDVTAEGELTLRQGAFQVVEAGIGIDDIRSTITFEPDLVRLSGFRAESGRGYIDAQGVMELAGLTPGAVDLEIRASNFRAANTAEYNAVINMDTKMTGTFSKPSISGDLIFLNGFVEMSNFGEKAVEDVELDDSLNTETDTATVYDSLSLNLNVSFDRRFYVRNQRYLELEIELSGEVDLQKQVNKELQMFGTMGTAGGYAKPLGKRFELEEGRITFTGDPANPQLSVRTRYEPPQAREDVIIWYVIEGTVENPQFKYESQPQMELENIISYTLFGQPFYALDSWKQVVASSGSSNGTVADVALEVLMDRVEALATQRLGIDVVRIENTRVGNESGTAITTGWYLNPKTFFAIQNVITGATPDTGFLLEYLLQKNLKLIISQGNDARQGIDLLWNFDY